MRHVVKLYQLLCSAIFATCLVVATNSTASSQSNVNVGINVGGTLLTVTGQTIPNALVTVLDDTTVIGTIMADSDGTFYQTYPAQTPGLHTIKVFATHGTTPTDTVIRNLNFTAQEETKFDVLIPPLFNLSQNGESPNETITFSGWSAPNTEVHIYLNAALLLQATTDADGKWDISINTLDIPSGTHSAYAIASNGLGMQSIPTSARSFTISHPEQPSPPSPEQPPITRLPSSPAYIPPPTISFPTPGMHTTNKHLTIRGQARAYAQIELWDNDERAGSVFANGLGQWELPYTLSQPEHRLKVRVCTSSGCSRFSATITVYYTAPQLHTGLDFSLSTYLFAGINPGQHINLDLTITSGKSPYGITVDWGDGEIETFQSVDNNYRLTHAYESAGNYNASVTVTDENGESKMRLFSVSVTAGTESTNVRNLLLCLLALLVLLVIIAWRRRKNKDNKEE